MQMQSEQLYVSTPAAVGSADTNARPRRDLNLDHEQAADLSPAPSNIAIPANKGSKKYSLQEVFNIWAQINTQVLNQPSSAKTSEIYKNKTPGEIYHLDLRAQPELHGNGDPNAVLPKDLDAAAASSLASLSLDNQPSRKLSVPPPNLPAPAPDRLSVATDTSLVSPENILWFYLDPTGNEQGPFAGTVMQEWLTDGYLTFDLRIRRLEEAKFYPLKTLCDSLQNFLLPFKVPLPDLSVSADSPLLNASTASLINGQSATGPASSAFASGLYSPLLPNNGLSGLSAASMRMSSSNHLFDFMGSTPTTEYPLMNQQPQFGPSQSQNFGIDPVNLPNLGGHNLSQSNLGLSSNLGQLGGSNISQTNLALNLGLGNLGQNNLGNLNQNFVNGGFGQLHMPSLLQQQIQQQQQPTLSRTNSGWGLDSPTTLMGANSPTPSAINTNIGGLSGSSPMSPWATGVQSVSRVSSPFVPQSTLASATATQFPQETEESAKANEDSVLNDLHSSMVTGILNEDDQKQKDFSEPLPQKEEPVPLPTEPVEVPGSFPEPSPQKPKQKAQSPVRARAPKKEQAPASAPSQPEPVSAPSQPEPVSQAPAPSSAPAFSEKPSEPAAPKLAPWAKASSAAATESKPTMTLKEVQALEAARLRKEKQQKAEQKQESAAIANALAASKEEEPQPQPEKATFNWANNGSQAQPTTKKTLAEIQKEEAEAARSKNAAAKTSGSNGTAKVSLASSLANSVPKEDSAWTTVVSKKQPAPKKPAQPAGPTAATISSANTISPNMLRAASANTVNTHSVNSNVLKEDFLVWARSAMTNLYPSVSKNDLLEIFTTLPLHSDSSQLISETIYSSSATMDGRRFAQEFMKKRQQVERQIGSGDSGSWSSAIISSADKVPSVDDEGWSTSSKSKKRGKKN